MTEFRYPEDCKGNDQIADFWAVRLDQGDLTAPEDMAFKAWQFMAGLEPVCIKVRPNTTP